jgi:hypothetical protein
MMGCSAEGVFSSYFSAAAAGKGSSSSVAMEMLQEVMTSAVEKFKLKSLRNIKFFSHRDE